MCQIGWSLYYGSRIWQLWNLVPSLYFSIRVKWLIWYNAYYFHFCIQRSVNRMCVKSHDEKFDGEKIEKHLFVDFIGGNVMKASLSSIRHCEFQGKKITLIWLEAWSDVVAENEGNQFDVRCLFNRSFHPKSISRIDDVSNSITRQNR